MGNEKTIETLERCFTYLGCANLDTRSMNGAVPIDALNISKGNAVGAWEGSIVRTTGSHEWTLKTVGFSPTDGGLRLNTSVGLSPWVISAASESKRKLMRKIHGDSLKNWDEVMRVYFSEIDDDGNFRKFKVKRRDVAYKGSDFKVSRHFSVESTYATIVKHNRPGGFNPSDTLMFCVHAQNKHIAEETIGCRGATMFASIYGSLGNHWTVDISVEESCPTLKMITDCTGVHELWKMRDLPEGRSRRKALLHWVSSHWRKDRNDPDLERYVRKHLRGSRKFSQGMFAGNITESERDTIEVEDLKRGRKEMKNKKRDVRRRRSLLGSSQCH